MDEDNQLDATSVNQFDCHAENSLDKDSATHNKSNDDRNTDEDISKKLEKNVHSTEMEVDESNQSQESQQSDSFTQKSDDLTTNQTVDVDKILQDLDADKMDETGSEDNTINKFDNKDQDTDKVIGEMDLVNKQQNDNKESEPTDSHTKEKTTNDEECAKKPTLSGKDDEELCIIPDTERVISQEEKDAATQKNSTEETKTCENGDNVVDNLNTDEKNEKHASKDNWTTENEDSNDKENLENKLIKLDEEIEKNCKQCDNTRNCNYRYDSKDGELYFCEEDCYKTYIKAMSSISKPTNKFKVMRDKKREPLFYVRMCNECKKKIADKENTLTWECMEFCNEDCLAKYQTSVGGSCANCKASVPLTSLGKYCVRFGYDIRQFCTSSCLEDFKKSLKVCSCCQKDISSGLEGFLAPVGDKGQFKDFCSQECMQKYDRMSNKRPPKKQVAKCDVCSNEKLIRLEIEVEGIVYKLCSEPCFVAFKFANNVSPEQCHMCQKYFEQTTLDYTIFFEDQPHHFCSKTCQNVYIIANRKIVPCQWCKVKKYNFDMIKKIFSNNQPIMMCSINCLALHQVSVNAVSARKTKCDQCKVMNQAQYHLTMSDATIRNFCSYPCVLNFQNQFTKSPITITSVTSSVGDKINLQTLSDNITSKRTYSKQTYEKNREPPKSPQLPIITKVQSLAPAQTNGVSKKVTHSKPSVTTTSVQTVETQTSLNTPPILDVNQKYIQQILVQPSTLPEVKNKTTMCKPNAHTKGVSFKPHVNTQENQTDDSLFKTSIVPLPIPIYVPTPMSMFSLPFPVPAPFPLPIPVPVFIPTTRNSANGIMKEINKIQVKMPTDPFEAELLMMAEMVAGDKKTDKVESESDDDDFNTEAVDTSNTFGDDMLQMALKMANELNEPVVDLEGALTANTITPSQSNQQVNETNQQMIDARGTSARGRKRQSKSPRGIDSKRARPIGNDNGSMMYPTQTGVPTRSPEPAEKPDANMCLKYTFGVNAWKQWITAKNSELEKTTLPIKPFKTEILQLTADELNYTLCMFVKEVRKPNGSEYAPDTIYYLCLGIQQYLYENGRIDNIFTDFFYEKFTDCLDEIARKFSVLYNDSHYIVTRVEEEHLWESKQLGAHSPYVLLSTLMFFNTKHFNLTTVDEHMQLSFSHIMKHWKRNPNQPGASRAPASRNLLLRFYPPQSALNESTGDVNTRKKRVYEQQENEENPLRCPVKLYEFYLSKCPESVKTRNDLFYLLPERSCVPDSPVWYSTMSLGRQALEKMLHRVKMVKEINVALLTS